jgi:hypothetical protein
MLTELDRELVIALDEYLAATAPEEAGRARRTLEANLRTVHRAMRRKEYIERRARALQALDERIPPTRDYGAPGDLLRTVARLGEAVDAGGRLSPEVAQEFGALVMGHLNTFAAAPPVTSRRAALLLSRVLEGIAAGLASPSDWEDVAGEIRDVLALDLWNVREDQGEEDDRA